MSVVKYLRFLLQSAEILNSVLNSCFILNSVTVLCVVKVIMNLAHYCELECIIFICELNPSSLKA